MDLDILDSARAESLWLSSLYTAGALFFLLFLGVGYHVVFGACPYF